MMRMLTLLLVALACFGSARAADLPQPYLHGFSADGEYHALLSTWRQDGSGFAAAHLRVVRQGMGVLVDDRLTLQGAEATPQSAAELLWQRHATRLKRLGLSRPIAGRPLYVSPTPLPALLSGKVETGDMTLHFGPADDTALRTLRLTETPAPREGCEYGGMLPEGNSPVGFRLEVNGREWFSDGPNLPEARACTFAYRIESVWALGGAGGEEPEAIAVLLRVYQPAFEGPDALPLTLLVRP